MSTATQHRFDARQASGALLVEHCDIPDGMTLGEWRAACAAERRATAEHARSGHGRLLRALRRR